MIFYNFDAATKKYAGSQDVEESLEFPGVFYPPANSTHKELPVEIPEANAYFVNDNWVLISDEDYAADLAAKNALIQSAYDQMNVDIYAQMSLVFGTTNADSANAYHETWKLMLARPERFVSSEFLSEGEVVSYAQAKINSTIDYAIFRMERIKQFRNERDIILAE